VEIPRRAELARFLAPAAFLLALTIAVLLVRAGLGSGDGNGQGTTPLTGLVTERTSTTPTTTRTSTRTTPSAKRFYTIQSGDTLATVALKFGTTTEKLLALNPGIDPQSLTVGQKVRVA
jgi:LysM repeat protein